MSRALWFNITVPVALLIAIALLYFQTSTAEPKSTFLYVDDTIHVSTQIKQRTKYGDLLVKRHNATQFLTIGITWLNVWELRNRTNQPITVNLKTIAYFHSHSYTQYIKHTPVPDSITISPGETITLSVQSYVDPAIIEDTKELMSRRAYVGLVIYDLNEQQNVPKSL
jgi:cytochrome c oxidase assembly protein Cox11